MLAVFMELTGGHFASVWQLIRNPICALTLYSCYRTTCTKRGVHISLLLHISRQILKKVAHPHGSDAATVEEYTLAGFRSGFPPVKMAFYFFLISLFDLDTHAAVYTPPPLLPLSPASLSHWYQTNPSVFPSDISALLVLLLLCALLGRESRSKSSHQTGSAHFGAQRPQNAEERLFEERRRVSYL